MTYKSHAPQFSLRYDRKRFRSNQGFTAKIAETRNEIKALKAGTGMHHCRSKLT